MRNRHGTNAEVVFNALVGAMKTPTFRTECRTELAAQLFGDSDIEDISQLRLDSSITD